MRLGELIDRLEQLVNAFMASPDEIRVVLKTVGQVPGRITDGQSVRRLFSYRGFYNRLAIEPARFEDEDKYLSEFLGELKDVVGKELTGYKGGEFEMTEDTLVHVDSYGAANSNRVVAVAIAPGRVELVVAHVEEAF